MAGPAQEPSSLEETVQARARWPDDAVDTRWVRTWKPDESRTSGRRAKARLIIKGFTDPDLPNIESHSPSLTRAGFMTVLQSVCSHGHKLQFGDAQQAFNTGDPIKRGQPLFVRMPPDGIRDESREAWVQVLKKVNGLADGTREWRNCFLVTARGIGFETSVLEPCVLVLRSSQQRYHGVLEWSTATLLVEEMKSGSRQFLSKRKVSHFDVGKWEM